MSWAEYLNKLSLSAKSIILSLIIILPFWLVSIFLFKRPLYDQGDYLILGAFCFCFTLAYYALHPVLVFIALKFLHVEATEKQISGSYMTIGLFSIFNLCLWIAVGWHYAWTFEFFLKAAFSYPALIAAVITVLRFRSKLSKSKAKKSDRNT